MMALVLPLRGDSDDWLVLAIAIAACVAFGLLMLAGGRR
jgi:hypothetical protein